METALYAILIFILCAFVAVIGAWILRVAVCLARGRDNTCHLDQVRKSGEFQPRA